MSKFFSKSEIKNFKHALDNEGVFVFPTDTVWGIGCLPSSKLACKKIYDIKKRDGQKPLILLGASLEDLAPYVKEIPEIAKRLANQYWPGALTIILKKSSLVDDYMSSGFDTVGVRIPDHPVLLELLKNIGPIASTSANLSTELAAKSIKDVKPEIIEQINFTLEDFEIPCKGEESTVIIIENEKYKVLRNSAINL